MEIKSTKKKVDGVSIAVSVVMIFFGLSPRTAFLWLVSNTLGLAYGAGIMIEEAEKGETTKEENKIYFSLSSYSYIFIR